MAAVILDGKALAKKRKAEIASRVAGMKQKPGLAVIIVGNNPASRTYVDNKKRDCAECGILSREYALPEDTGEEELLKLISELNRDDEIDGILVQLPLPKSMSEDRILTAIDPQKDVDAFHPYNVGLILTGKPVFLPCTPAGVMTILDEYQLPVEGRRCVVVGRSNIVGKPQALLLLQRNGTVTVCHSRTKDLPAVTREADILVSAVGKRGVITGDMVKSGAVVIDVAMNRNEAGKLCGDCAFEEVSVKASYITPVPGGVGPMTRVMLLENTLKAAGLHQKL